jgi:hypothetical protein
MDATVASFKSRSSVNHKSGFRIFLLLNPKLIKQELPMKVIVTVVEKITSEAHIDIPDGLNQSAIKQHIVDRYNTGEMVTAMNIFQVDFESISARIVKEHSSTKSV